MSLSPSEFLQLCATFGVQTGAGGGGGLTPIASGNFLANTSGVVAVPSATSLDIVLQAANDLSDVGSTTTSRTNLGLASMSIQAANDVDITGGTVDVSALSAPFTYADVPGDEDLAIQDSLTAFVFPNASVDLADALGLSHYTDGFTFSLKNISSGDCTFTPFTGQFIDGMSQLVMPAMSGYLVTKNPTTWSIIANTGSSGGGVTASQIQTAAFTHGTDTGVADAYVVALSPAITSYSDGQVLSFTPANNSTSDVPTVDFGGGAFTIVLDGGNHGLLPNDITNGVPCYVAWSSDDDSWNLLNPLFSYTPAMITGTGTQSAVGGDGSTTATNSYGFCWGSGSSTSTGVGSVTFGDTQTNAGQDALTAGNNNTVGSSAESSLTIGSSNTNNAQNGFVIGTGCQLLGALNGAALGQGAVSNNDGSVVWCDSVNGASDSVANQYVLNFAGGFNYMNANAAVFGADVNKNFITSAGIVDQSYSYQVVSTGFTITPTVGVATLALAASGTLATGTIDLSSLAPIDGQIFRVYANNTITALTVSGAPINNAPTTLVAGQGFALQYSVGATTWNVMYQASSGGGSSPWIAGGGTGSAIGGDGTATASGNYALSYGNNSTAAQGLNSVAIGNGVTAEGPYCWAFGNGSFTGTTNYGLAWGLNCESHLGDYGWAIGNGSVTGAAYTFAFGYQAVADGLESFAFGHQSDSHGANSFAFGSNNTRTGGSAPNSFAFGDGNVTQTAFGVAWGSSVVQTHAGSWVLGDSNASPPTDSAANQFVRSFAGGYLDYVGSTLMSSVDANGNVINHKGQSDQGYSYQVVGNGFTLTPAAGVRTLVLAPSGTIASGTIAMGSLAPVDGQLFRVYATNTVTALTVNGATVNNVPTTITAGLGFELQYNLANTAWNVVYQNTASGSGVAASQIQTNAFTHGADTGAANAYVVALSPAISTYTDGQVLVFTPTHSSTSASPTIDFGGGARTIYVGGGVQGLLPGDITGGIVCVLVYNAGNIGFNLINPCVSNSAAITFGTGSVSGLGVGATAALGAYSFAWGNNTTSTNNGAFVLSDSTGSNNTDTAVDQFVATYAGGFYNYVGASILAQSIDTGANFITHAGVSDQSYSLQVPSDAFSIAMAPTSDLLILQPVATLPTGGTVALPYPAIDGQVASITTSQIITMLTVTGGGGSDALANPYAAALNPGAGINFVYNLAQTLWFQK